DAVLYPNWSGVFGLFDVRHLDAMYPARYFPFLQAFGYGVGKSPEVADNNLTNRYSGEEAVLDPLSNKNLDTVVRLWRLSSVRYILGTVSHIIEPVAPDLEKIFDANVSIDKDYLKLVTVSVGGTTKRAMLQHPFPERPNVVSYMVNVSSA